MAGKGRQGAGKTGARSGEAADHLESLRRHGRVIEADSEDVELPPGVTHVLVKRDGGAPRLVEKRKSFF